MTDLTELAREMREKVASRVDADAVLLRRGANAIERLIAERDEAIEKARISAINTARAIERGNGLQSALTAAREEAARMREATDASADRNYIAGLQKSIDARHGARKMAAVNEAHFAALAPEPSP